MAIVGNSPDPEQAGQWRSWTSPRPQEVLQGELGLEALAPNDDVVGGGPLAAQLDVDGRGQWPLVVVPGLF